MIFYDNIIFSLQRAGGISTYWGELIQRLLRDRRSVVFAEAPNENLVRSRLPISNDQISVRGSGRPLLERFKKVNFQSPTPFVFHSSYNRAPTGTNALRVCTVHDFVHEQYYSGLRRRLHCWQKRECISYARRIIAVSENTKRDLLKFYPHLDPEIIHVVYNGVSEDFYPLGISTSSNTPFLLFVGSRQHYKNFNFTVDLVRKLKGFDLYLVGGGRLTEKEKNVLSAALPGRWKEFQGIDNAQLNNLYNLAYALLYPSSYEGFGIPILEGMRAGCPFIALNRSSIPEVAGGAGILMEDLNLDSFRNAVLEIGDRREELRTAGFSQVVKFSWEKCYQETVALYNDLLNENINYHSCL